MSIRLAPSMSPDTQFFWDGLEGAPAPHPALHGVRRAAPPAPADVPVVQLARRGTRSRPRAGARSTASSCRGTRQCPFLEHATSWRSSSSRRARASISNLCDVAPDDVSIGMPVEVVLRRLRRRPGAAPVPPGGWRDDGASATSSPCWRSTMTATRDRRRRHRHARLHAGAPRPRLRQQPGRARHLHEHHLDQRATAAGTSPTGPVPTRCCKRLAIRLGVPVFPGLDAHLHRRGHRRASATATTAVVDVEFRAANDLGDHATGHGHARAARPAPA